MYVFGTELHLYSFVIIIIQIAILINLLINAIKEPYNKSDRRFLIFTFLILLHNTASGLLPDSNFPINQFLQIVIAYAVAVISCSYYAYYVYVEFDLNIGDIFTFKYLQIGLIGTFIAFFVIPLLIYGDMEKAKRIYIAFPIAIGLVFAIKVINPFRKLYLKTNQKEQRYYRNRILTAYIAVICLAILPILVAFGDFQLAELSVVNTGYFLLMFSVIMENINRSLKRKQFLEQMGYSDAKPNYVNVTIINRFIEFDLTYREIEISLYILDGMTYKSISDILYRTEGTVTKHASNIFKKAGVPDRKAFKTLFEK